MSIFFLSFIRTWTKLSTLAGHSRTPVAGQGVMTVWGKAVLPCPERTLGGDWTALVFPGTSCKVLHQPLFLLSWSNEEGKKPREFPRRFICQEVILHLSSDTQQFTFARMLVCFLVCSKSCFIFHNFLCEFQQLLKVLDSFNWRWQTQRTLRKQRQCRLSEQSLHCELSRAIDNRLWEKWPLNL